MTKTHWPFPKSEDFTATNTTSNNVVHLHNTNSIDFIIQDTVVPQLVFQDGEVFIEGKTIDLESDTPSEVFWQFRAWTSTQTNVHQIKPCPFCGSNHVAHIKVPQYEKPDLPSETWIQCGGCGAEVHSHHVGTSSYTPPIDIWNQRR